MRLRLLTWNLFHGRDHPPDPSLFTWRSRLLRTTEHGDRYAQVNRSLLDEFAVVLGRLEWDVALLQEAPPRWLRPLGELLGASGASALTDRNGAAVLRSFAARLNPDLIASTEGGSNQLLARPPWRVAEVRRHTLTRRPERRRMLWARLVEPGGRTLAVANLHGSVGAVKEGIDQVVSAAEQAIEWAGELPLVFGGDLNLSVKHQPHAFERLGRLGLAAPTSHDAIDHLLVRGLEVVEAPHALAPEAHQVPAGEGRVLQLSDHFCVAATAGMR